MTEERTYVDIETVYGIIYFYTNKINGKRYIGKTIRPEERHKEHVEASKKTSGSKFHNAIHKYGIENFEYCILEAHIMPKELAQANLNVLERYWIKLFDSHNKGYNMTDGGDGGGGFKHYSGEKAPMYGKHHSLETRQHWSEIRKGVPNHMKGKTYSEEKRKNMGLKKGCKAYNKGYKYPPEICEHMGAPKGTHRVYHEDGSWHMEK